MPEDMVRNGPSNQVGLGPEGETLAGVDGKADVAYRLDGSGSAAEADVQLLNLEQRGQWREHDDCVGAA